MILPDNILVRILESLYFDFLESDECIDISEHHCSLLHPCISISKSTTFKPIYTFRLISSHWNKFFRSNAKLDRYGSHRIQDYSRPIPTYHMYDLLRQSVAFKRYRIFRKQQYDQGTLVCVAYDFGVIGGCKDSREVIIKAWMGFGDEYKTELTAYETLSVSLMKGCPFLIENALDSDRCVYALVLEKLGPSLEDLCNLMSPVRFDEKMTLAVAIQMLDRYADLHARKIIHNGAKPGNICIASLSSSAADASTLNLIDFGFSFFFCDKTRLDQVEEFCGNKRFWSVLSFHDFTQSQRDDLESLGYLLSALFQGSLPWDPKPRPTSTWCMKMSTPGSTLFRNMDPSFLEYWKDVRSLAFSEVPDYFSLKSRFVQCWERNGFGGSPGEYDWVALFKRLVNGGREKTPVVLQENGAPEIPPVPGNSSHSSH